MAAFSYILMTMLGFSGIFLIGLILLQRGRGGGLAGAFGGMGGQSAFGTKAGDVFTRITIGVASAWILLCAGSVLALHYSASIRYDPGVTTEPVQKASPKDVEKANPKDLDGAKPNKEEVDKKDADAANQEEAGKIPPAPGKPGDENQADNEKPVEDEKPKEPVKPDNPEPRPD